MKRRTLLFSMVLAAILIAADVHSDWNVRDHIPLNDVLVQSHRGGGASMPENSIETFEYAWKLGTVPEADLRTTSDGVIVAFHDANLARILPDASRDLQKRGVQDITWSELSKIDIGSWRGAAFAGQRAPRMLDVYKRLAQAPVRRMYLDIKNVNLEQLAREAKSAGVARQLIVASPDQDVLMHWKQLAPESSTLLWMGGSEDQLAARLHAVRQKKFAGVTQLQIHVRAIGDLFAPSPEFLLRTGAELRKHGILFQVFPWESKDPKLFRSLLDVGVASFATDYPESAMIIIRDYYQERR
jgi:glycerophosphoryl diester phosphodiesterase